MPPSFKQRLKAGGPLVGTIVDPDVQQAMSTVRRHAMRAGIPLGIFGATAEAVQPFIDRGYTLIAVGIDTLLVTAAAQEIVTSVRPAELTKSPRIGPDVGWTSRRAK